MSNSMYFDILAAVKQRILGVCGEIIPVIRKRPILLVTDQIPAIIVNPGPGAEQVGLETFARGVEYRYPVTVTIIHPGDRVTEVDVQGHLELRERIRNALFQPLLDGVVSVHDTEIDLDPPYTTAAGPTSVYDVAAIRLTFLSIETRTA